MALLASSITFQPLTGAIFSETQYFEGIPNLSIPMVFNQWDATWGTINSILVTLNLYANGGALRVDNDSGLGATSTVAFGGQVALSSSDVPLLNNIFQPVLGSALVAATSNSVTLSSNDLDLEVGGTANFSQQGSDYGQILGGSVSNSRSGAIGAFFNGSYVGTNTFTVFANANQFVNLGSFGGAQQQIDPLSVSGSVTFTYDYSGSGPPEPEPEPGPSEVVPEPSVFSLMLMAVLSFVFFAKKKRTINPR